MINARLAMVSAAHVRSRALLTAAVTFISYAYFYEGGGWNQNSRYYSDKAAGVALLAVPVALASRPVLRSVGVDPESPRGLVAISYFATIFTVRPADGCGVQGSVPDCLEVGGQRASSSVCRRCHGIS